MQLVETDSLQYLVGYFLGGLAVVGITCMFLSLIGLFAVGPLIHKAVKLGRDFQLAVVDGLCLAAILGVLSKSIWDAFPAGDKVDATIFVLAICFIATIWWFVLGVSMSRIGGVSSAFRACYQLWVVPSAFLTPLLITYILLEIWPSWSWRPSLSDAVPAMKFASCVIAYLACIPLTSWMLKRAEANQEDGHSVE